MTTTLTETHESNRGRRMGFDENDEPVYGYYECGKWADGGTVLCDHHEAIAAANYPQGWAYYPGDVCPHHRYTGGSGADLMCGACEMGGYDTAEDALEEAAFMLRHTVATMIEDRARYEEGTDYSNEVIAAWRREVTWRAELWFEAEQNAASEGSEEE